MLEDGEGWFFRSDNILTERDADRIEWQMLPDGEHGLRADEFGSTQEEHNLVDLPDGSLYCVYRTTTGYPCHAYSRDGGHTWTKPVHMTYRPDGRRIKNPRACPRLWKTSNGRYLFWFHNHSGKDFHHRNPAWVVGGEARKGKMYWSEPEIVLYDPDPKTRMSYPDLIEEGGRYWITETQKEIARVHEIDPALFEGLWNQGKTRTVTRRGLVLDLDAPLNTDHEMPTLPNLAGGDGFSIDLRFNLPTTEANQTILDARDESGKGVVVRTTDIESIRLEMNDGKLTAHWDCDPDLFTPGHDHHVTITVDGGPKIITFVVDGRLCDGGDHRQFGWGRFDPQVGDVNGSRQLRLMPEAGQGRIQEMRVYETPLRTSEAIANYHAHLSATPVTN
jgi:hypothetical protein